MRRVLLLGLLSCSVLGALSGQMLEDERINPIMRRGDANSDGTVNATDAMYINN